MLVVNHEISHLEDQIPYQMLTKISKNISDESNNKTNPQKYVQKKLKNLR